MDENFLVLVLVIAIMMTVIALLLWVTDKVLVDKPAKPKVDLTYNPLAVDTDVNIPPQVTGEARERMVDALTGKQDLRYNPLSTDEDVCMPVRSRPPSQS